MQFCAVLAWKKQMQNDTMSGWGGEGGEKKLKMGTYKSLNMRGYGHTWAMGGRGAETDEGLTLFYEPTKKSTLIYCHHPLITPSPPSVSLDYSYWDLEKLWPS